LDRKSSDYRRIAKRRRKNCARNLESSAAPLSGSAGYQPARLGSLPRPGNGVASEMCVQRMLPAGLPATTGWQLVLPRSARDLTLEAGDTQAKFACSLTLWEVLRVAQDDRDKEVDGSASSTCAPL